MDYRKGTMKVQIISQPPEFRDWCSNLKPIWALDKKEII